MTRTAIATVVATTIAAAEPTQPMLLIPEAQRPSSAMTTVPPAKKTERPAVDAANTVFQDLDEGQRAGARIARKHRYRVVYLARRVDVRSVRAHRY